MTTDEQTQPNDVPSPVGDGILSVVATPIGNLEDITFRAVAVLKEADVIAAEDTRQTSKLLARYGISSRLLSFSEHNQIKRGPRLLQLLREGKKVALVTDAGTPTVSDPGGYLVRLAVEHGVRVVPVPGPSAVLAALSVSGIPFQSFCFEGFLPSRPTQRRKRLQELAGESRTMVFYESPNRVEKMLSDVLEVWGDRRVAVAKELTKLHETVFRGPLSSVIDLVREHGPRGEYTVVVEGATTAVEVEGSIAEDLEILIGEQGMNAKEAVSLVAERRNVPKRDVYRESVKLKQATSGGRDHRPSNG